MVWLCAPATVTLRDAPTVVVCTAPTMIDRRFNEDRKIPEARVQAIRIHQFGGLQIGHQEWDRLLEQRGVAFADRAFRPHRITLHAKNDAVGEVEWEVSVDDTVIRAHQHAAGARKGSSAADEKRGS